MTRHYVLPLVVAIILSASPVRADLDSELGGMFNAMTSSTAPGVWESQRTGTISGGRLEVKTRIQNTNIMNFVPPSFKAGCGGIDLFGGSFSFISADQFIQLMRNIAANAPGALFQLALRNMCEPCVNVMNKMQDAVQRLNSLFSSSCNLAKGIAVDTIGRAFDNVDKEAGITAQVSKVATDIFDAWTDTSGTSPQNKAQQGAPSLANVQYGNIVWRALKRSNVSSWFAYGDDSLLEIFMNISGTLILEPDEKTQTAANGEQYGARELGRIPPNKVRLSDIMFANSSLKITGCDGDRSDGERGCIALQQNKTIPFTGLVARVNRTLLGDGSSIGVIAKLTTPGGAQTMLPHETAFMAGMGEGMGTMFVNLAKRGRPLVEAFAIQAAPYIALQMADRLARDIDEAIVAATGKIDHAFQKQIQEMVKDARAGMMTDVQKNQAVYGRMDIIVAQYRNLLQAGGTGSLAPQVSKPAAY